MLTGSVKSNLYKAFVEHEGSVPHMYLDTDGNVTVGIGHLLIDVAAAQLVTFYKAAKAEDWTTAAKHSHRKPPISAERNRYVKNLFLKAARQAKAANAKP